MAQSRKWPKLACSLHARLANVRYTFATRSPSEGLFLDLVLRWGECHNEVFARRRNCSPSEQAILSHFLDFATCGPGLCSFKINALKNELECLEKCLARLTGKFWGMTAAPVQYS